MRAEAFARFSSLTRCALVALALQCSLAGAAHAVLMKKVVFHDTKAATQVIIELNGPPTGLVVKDQPGQPMTVSFQAASVSGIKPLNKAFSHPNLHGVYLDNRQGKVQLFIKRNYIGSVSVSSSSRHLIVTIPHRAPAKTSPISSRPAGSTTTAAAVASSSPAATPQGQLANGIRHRRISQRGATGPVLINIIEIDPKNPAVEIMPTLASNRMGAKSNVAAMVSANQAVAGINGSFFKPDVGIPLGILIINQELISGPIYDRVALGISSTNDLVMARIRMAGEVVLPTGRKVPIHNINQPRVKADQTVVYSSRWGKSAPKVPGGGFQILLKNNRVMAVSQSAPLAIPRDGVVLSGPGTPAMTELAALGNARPIQLNVYTLPDWSGMKHAIGGGPWLVKDGRQYVDLTAQKFTGKSLGFREPRSAVGITADGRMLLVTVDGRRKNVSVGMTLKELAYLMQKLGAVQAMNLDGGSSTQMAVHGRTINQPSAGSIGVSNSLIVRQSNGDSMAVRE